jgi:thioredoxin-like negative regulator of GroEL
MDDLPTLTAAIAQDPDDGSRWLALAAWYTDQGRKDEGDAVRVLWRTFRANLSRATLCGILANLTDSAPLFGDIARQVERRAREGPDDGWPIE